MVILDFVGVSSTGKTTVMEEICKILKKDKKSVCIIPSISRTVAEKGVGTSESTELFTQAYISLVNWMNILDSVRSFKVVMTTDLGVRSTAYLSQVEVSYDENDEPNDLLFNNLLKSHFHFLRLLKSSYFLPNVKIFRFYIPAEFPAVPDGIRSEDKKYEENVNSSVLRILKGLKQPYTTLTGSIEERCKIVLNTINNYLV